MPLATSLYAVYFEVLFIKILLLINDFGVPRFLPTHANNRLLS